MTEHDCPHCGAPPSYREHLSEQWELCNVCARTYVLDANGQIVRWSDTNHAPQRKPVEQDTGGVSVDET